jgi:lipopolysaccharide heptosyltransferase I
MNSSPRILVVKLSSLGDLFHALPAVHEIKQGLGCSIDWLTQPEYRSLVGCFTDVDRVLEFPRRRFVRSCPAFFKALRESRYDYVLDFQGLFKSGLCARLARADKRIGPAYAREGAPLFYSALAGSPARGRHAVEEALDLARHLGMIPSTPVFPVRFPAKERTGPRPHIGLLPCSRWDTKNWPPGHFAKLAALLHQKVGGTLFLMGGPSDVDTGARIEKEADVPMQNLCGRTSLVEMGGMLDGMDLMITVDSGPMHMAVALGVPVLAVFGATDPKRTGPYGKGHVSLMRGGLDCQPCLSRVCLRPGQDLLCLNDLSPERVFATAQSLLCAREENHG